MSSADTSEPHAENPAAAAFAVGCTAVCVVMSRSYIVCANAGDSRAVLCQQAKAVPLSFDHKPTDEAERKRIINAGGYVKEIHTGEGHQRRVVHRINGNLNLSRSVGDLAYKTRDDLGPEQQGGRCYEVVVCRGVVGPGEEGLAQPRQHMGVHGQEGRVPARGEEAGPRDLAHGASHHHGAFGQPA